MHFVYPELSSLQNYTNIYNNVDFYLIPMYYLIVLFVVVQLMAVNKMLLLRILIYTITIISGLYFVYFIVIALGIFKKKKEKII